MVRAEWPFDSKSESEVIIRKSNAEMAATSNHLFYEIDMLIETGRELASSMEGQTTILKNATLESFTLHARVLLDFLYLDKPRRKDDVIASHFLEDSDQWKKVRQLLRDCRRKYQTKRWHYYRHIFLDRRSIDESRAVIHRKKSSIHKDRYRYQFR